MAFDAIELLNAFDIIKNETLYSKRLQKLADAQAELNQSEYIVKTVEVAQARFDEANRLLEQARKRMDNLEVEIENTRKKKLADITEQEKLLAERTFNLDTLAGSLNQTKQELQYNQTGLDKAQKAYQHSILDYDQRRLELNKREDAMNLKLEQLRKVIES